MSRCSRARRLEHAVCLGVAVGMTAPTPVFAQRARASQETSPNVGLFRLPAHRGAADALAGPEGFGFLSKDNKYVIPAHDFDASQGRLGAIELTVSAGSLSIDAGRAANQVSRTAATRLGRSGACGVNWYPNLGVRVMLDFSHTTLTPFTRAVSLPSESILVARLQVVL